jgi:hypothetical protein
MNNPLKRKKRFIGPKGYKISREFLVKAIHYWAHISNEYRIELKIEKEKNKLIMKELNELKSKV